MCKLLPSENPTEEGVWWRDDSKWCLYSSRNQALIKNGIAEGLQQVDLGTIVSTVHPKGARYVADLKNMEQVAVSSKQRRPIMVVEAVTVDTQIQVCQPPLTTSPPGSSSNLALNVHYSDGQGNFRRYDPEISQALLRCIMSGSQRTLLMPDGNSGLSFFFDLEKMEQRFVSLVVSGRPVFSDKAPVQIVVEIPWDASAMASIAAEADRRLRRKILVVVIERFRSNEHLDAVLPVKARPRRIAYESTSTCSAEQYEKFVDSVEDVLQRFPQDVFGELIRTAGTNEVNGGPLQVAFKPVDRSMEKSSSCKSVGGAEKSKRAFWMSMVAPLAAAHAVVYGSAVVKILAYLVIVPVSEWKSCVQTRVSDVCSGYVEVDGPEHGLLLAEVTVR